MKRLFKTMKNMFPEKAYFWGLIFILLAPGLHKSMIQPAIGAEPPDEPHISLDAKNQPLGDVLGKIMLDTGFKFRWDGQWSAHPVNASVKNVPLHRGLKLILQGLNHAIIYESDRSIKILIYGEVDARGTGSSPVRPFPSQIQDQQAEPAPSPEPLPEETDDVQRADDSSAETGASENTEDSGTENDGSADSENETNSAESESAAGKESERDSTAQSEEPEDSDERESAAEDASPEAAQNQD